MKRSRRLRMSFKDLRISRLMVRILSVAHQGEGYFSII